MVDDLRRTFDALHDKGMPPRPFEAADIIRASARKRRAHRTWAVLGTGLATAAAAAAALLLRAPEPAPETILPANPPPMTTSVPASLPVTPPVPTTTPASAITTPPTSTSVPTPPTSSPGG